MLRLIQVMKQRYPNVSIWAYLHTLIRGPRESWADKVLALHGENLDLIPWHPILFTPSPAPAVIIPLLWTPTHVTPKQSKAKFYLIINILSYFYVLLFYHLRTLPKFIFPFPCCFRRQLKKKKPSAEIKLFS